MTERKRMRGYKEAVAWVALNGEHFATSAEGADMVPVLLVAHIYRREPEEVARAVVSRRSKMGSDSIKAH